MRQFILIASFALSATFAGTLSASADWALAVGQEHGGAWALGDSWNYPGRHAAERKALDNCVDRGSNCKVIAHGAGGCVAIAFGTEDNAYGWSQRDNEDAASRNAIHRCEGESSGQCVVKGSFCDR